MPESEDEAVAEAGAPAASPPNEHVVEIKASAADALLGSTSFETGGADPARRLPLPRMPFPRKRQKLWGDGD
jgi:hypothetical protein